MGRRNEGRLISYPPAPARGRIHVNLARCGHRFLSKTRTVHILNHPPPCQDREPWVKVARNIRNGRGRTPRWKRVAGPLGTILLVAATATKGSGGNTSTRHRVEPIRAAAAAGESIKSAGKGLLAPTPRLPPGKMDDRREEQRVR